RCSSGGDPAQADSGDHIEEQEIAESHDLPRAIGIFRLRDGDARRKKGDVLRWPRRYWFGQSQCPRVRLQEFKKTHFARTLLKWETRRGITLNDSGGKRNGQLFALQLG